MPLSNLEVISLINTLGGKLIPILPRLTCTNVVVKNCSREALLKELRKKPNFISALFYLENSPGKDFPKAFEEVLDVLIGGEEAKKLDEIFSDERKKDAVNRFLNWCNYNYLSQPQGLTGDMTINFMGYIKGEVMSLLQKSLEEEVARIRQEGREEGREEGKQVLIDCIREYIQQHYHIEDSSYLLPFLPLLSKKSLNELQKLLSAMYNCANLSKIEALIRDIAP